MTGLNEIENVYGETVEFYDLSALSQIGNKKIVLNKFADMVKDLDGIILDIGAGSGVISITIAKEKTDSKILGVDISDNALEIANKNKSLLKADNVKFLKSNLFQEVLQ